MTWPVERIIAVAAVFVVLTIYIVVTWKRRETVSVDLGLFVFAILTWMFTLVYLLITAVNTFTHETPTP